MQDDRGEDDAGAVVAGVLVVAGRDAAPAREPAERALDDVASAVGLAVERRRSPAAGPAPGPVLDLVGSLRDDGDDGLFEMTPVEPAVVESGPVDKTLRRFDPGQAWLVPPSLDDWVPQEHIARLIADLVDEHLDLSSFYADYAAGRRRSTRD